MVSTAIKLTTTSTNYKYYPGFGIIYGDENHLLSESVLVRDKMERPIGKSIRFVSPTKKVFLTAYSGMFHFWYDSAGPLLSFIKDHPGIEVIVDTSVVQDQLDGSFFNFFLKMLTDNNVKYQTIRFEEYDSIVANNFYTHESIDRIYDPANTVYEYAERYLDKSVVPFRTVYLSRKEIGDRSFDGESRAPGLSFDHDNRIDDERELENYLSSLGVEIVVPEDFASFEDQIKYFNEVKTVISLTSSGLTNAIFMQPGCNVIEFVTPLIASLHLIEGTDMTHGEEALHNLYNMISFFKGHTYASIPNKDRRVSTLIDKIESSQIISRIANHD